MIKPTFYRHFLRKYPVSKIFTDFQQISVIFLTRLKHGEARARGFQGTRQLGEDILDRQLQVGPCQERQPVRYWNHLGKVRKFKYLTDYE